MMNQQAMDSLYSATYLEDFLDCVENVPDTIQRNISRLRDLDYSYNDYMKGLETAMEELLEEYDYEQDTQNMNEEELESLTAEEELKRFTKHKKYVKAKNKVQEFLVRAQDIGDEKLQLAQNVQDNVENKARQLDLDKKNLGECTKLRPREYGRDMDNAESQGQENAGGKRARRAKHDVCVPSILGPETLKVTSYDERAHGNETGAGGGKNKAQTKSRGRILLNANAEKGKLTEAAKQGSSKNGAPSSSASSSHDVKPDISLIALDVKPLTSRGAARISAKNNEKDGESEPASTRASERSSAAAMGSSNADKPVKRVLTAAEKKAGTATGGKKRKAKQTVKQEPEDDQDDGNDPIDPDEPTYCLCDQISYGEMIGCDNDLCPIEWFHFSCVSLTNKPKGKWYCPRCRGDKPSIMKTRAVLIKELAKYNREREEKA